MIINHYRLRRRRHRCTSGLALAGALGFLLNAGDVARGQCGTEIAKLVASDAGYLEYMGASVAISNNVAVAGSPAAADNGFSAGSAYVFRFDGTTWNEEQEIIGSDVETYDGFGKSIAVDGDIIVAGAPGDDDLGSDTGAAYVFHFNGSSWVEEQKLTASDGASFDQFGLTVSISGDVIVVGSYYNDEAGNNAGAAYVYHFDGSSWNEEQKLIGADTETADFFGHSVAVWDDTILVGVPYDDDIAANSGSAYVFVYDGSEWNEQAKLAASDPAYSDKFGNNVALSGDVALIGADDDDDNGSNSGSAYVFRFDGSSWDEEAKLLAADGADNDSFGAAVSVFGDAVLIGAPGNGADSGAAYLFLYNNGWNQEAKIDGSDTFAGDRFGEAVSIWANESIAGAKFEDEGATDGGAAYIFNTDCNEQEPDCNANEIPDDQDIAEGTSEDCNGNLIPDECESDSDDDGTIDACDDCPNDPDKTEPGECGCGVPEGQCPDCPADLDGDGQIAVQDMLTLMGEWGPNPGSPADLNGNGEVEVNDLLQLMSNWGPCP